MLQKEIYVDEIFPRASAFYSINLHCCYVFGRRKPEIALRYDIIYPIVFIINEIHFYTIDLKYLNILSVCVNSMRANIR